jgi:2-haloacid dehalogenase
MKYQLIAFDAYGTLLDVYAVAARAEQLFPGHGKLLSQLWRDKQLEYTRLISLADSSPQGSQYYQSFWDITIAALHFGCKQLRLNLTPDNEAQLLEQYAHLDAFAESTQVLGDVRTLGLKTCVLSNGNPEMLSAALGHSQLTHYFDAVISVDEARQFKITPASYQLVLKHFSVPKNQVLFISCNAWDIIGANWFGFDTFWVNRYQLPFEEIGLPPNYSGPNLNALLPYLKTTPSASQ